jgi:hypothetical protein
MQALRTVRWNLSVSETTDRSLRMYLAQNGRGKKGDLSQVIEEAVLSYIFDRTAKQVKSGCENMSVDGISSLIDEALDWARHS